MGPFSCTRGDGLGLAFSHMTDGRPTDNHYFTFFLGDGSILNLDSLESKTKVSGW